MSSPRLYKQFFDFTGGSQFWLCPAGVKYIIVSGCGGGGGGGSGGSSSGRGAYGRATINFAGGGSGGQPAITVTQTVPVTPGVQYTVSVAGGGAGGAPNCVANIVDGGGCRPGNPGSDGGSTSIGSVIFPGGKGGREGGLISIFSLTFQQGQGLANCAVYSLITIGANNALPQNIAQHATLPTNPTGQGLSHFAWRTGNSVANGQPYSGEYSIAGGGTGGGLSNNYRSTGGTGGDGALGFDGHNFPFGGGNGSYGGGGGGGGGGENWDWNNTHDGASGGAGGNGFLEISWVA